MNLPTNILIPSELVILLLASVTIISCLSCLLYIREYYLRKSAYKKQFEISAQTRQKSLQLLTAAELAETQVLAEGKFATQKLTEELKNKLENLVADSGKSVAEAEKSLLIFMEALKKTAEATENKLNSAREQRINDLFEKLETKLSDFLIQTEQKTTSSIELELTSTRQLIDTYKTAQLKLIDENIIAMMEQTLNLVLAKKLSLKDQLELVYEALEKAKIDKFIV